MSNKKTLLLILHLLFLMLSAVQVVICDATNVIAQDSLPSSPSISLSTAEPEEQNESLAVAEPTALPPETNQNLDLPTDDSFLQDMPASVPSTAPASKLPPVFEGKDDLITLNAAMAAAQFEVRPSLKNRADLVFALSKLVSQRCMATLHRSLIYRGLSDNKDCSEAISYTLSMDPSNPEAICARDGIDSAACRNAFREQRTSTFIPFPADWEIFKHYSVNVRIKESENSQKLSNLFKELSAASTAFKTEKSVSNHAELSRVYTQILDLQCSHVLIIPNPEYEKEAAALERVSQQGENNVGLTGSEKKKDLPTYAQMLSQLAKSPAVTATPISGLFSRVRLIPEKCMDTIGRALDLLPEFPRAICHRDGFYSPSCITMLRKQKLSDAAKTPAASSTGLPAKGELQPF